MRKILLIISLVFLQPTFAKGVYQTAESFLQNNLKVNQSSNSSIWINKKRKQVITDILQHPPRFIRVKYWHQGSKTAWILDEVGKEKLITVGVVIENSKIETLKVLTFRESRGWEVKHKFFTHQFSKVGINSQHQLDQNIDGISGATLSVRALKKIARIALYLDKQR